MFRALLAITLALAACDRAPASAPATDDEAGIVTLINARRAEASCPAVTADDQLTAAARRHAADMQAHEVRDHTGSDGSSAAARIADAGYAASRTGEIIYWAQGSGSAQEAVAAWMNSPSHRDIIEECSFTHVGVAVLRAGTQYFAVADFGAR